MFNIAVIVLVLTALLAYVNHRFVRLPSAIGVMVIALLGSLILAALNGMGFPGLHHYETSLLSSIDFPEVVFKGLLSMLLFAAALGVDFSDLRSYRWHIAALAVLGTVASTLLIGFAVWTALSWVGLSLSLPYCLIFGALISPTDPVAVAGIIRQAGAPRSMDVVISGESLFNDGIGVVLFTILLGMIAGGGSPDWTHGAILLAREAGGGLIYGLVLGYITYRLLRSIDNYQVEITITLAAVLGGYALAREMEVSGPLAMVVAGLVVGDRGRELGMSEVTRKHHDEFWELLDWMLNSVLFVLVGLEFASVTFSAKVLLVAAGMIVVALLARLLCAGLPMAVLSRYFTMPRGAWQVLTWGGLRGAISVALALSLPPGPSRDLILGMTYYIVVFSILVQGLSIGKVVRWATAAPKQASNETESSGVEL
ncbi:sodium:proton antiporter [Oleiagrimonas sp.]|jgi:CPA1 family monovalent cation:H+ antiporter|uniref:cation:proton antiporter n=1 Tax=Oleiagrimonas sp. TaxID=2010330 RepID=UPI0026039FC7|nr:sodium:proton antiporter [Oleiagrimonas sp.]MDA3914331.1 sodium:proton antiporter [Oleiagrimonas sp.]